MLPVLNTCLHFVADIDECQRQADVCPPRQTCRNTFGSFVCVCQDGFVMGTLKGSVQCRGKKTKYPSLFVVVFGMFFGALTSRRSPLWLSRWSHVSHKISWNGDVCEDVPLSAWKSKYVYGFLLAFWHNLTVGINTKRGGESKADLIRQKLSTGIGPGMLRWRVIHPRPLGHRDTHVWDFF